MDVGIVLSGHNDVLAEARQAEALGFSFVACGEHVFFNGPTSNAFVVLAAAAAATERLRLLTSITLLPLYPAALVAKLAATLDRVSGGRLDLGVGVGGESRAEFDACGVPVSERGARTDEALDVLTRLFGGDEVTFDGRFTHLDGVTLDPPPVQRPRPPIWVGGRKDGAMRRAARYADVWMPYMYTPEQLALSLDRIGSYAAELGRPGAVDGAVFLWLGVGRDREQAHEAAVAKLGAVYRQNTDRMLERYVPTGDPAAVAARIDEFGAAGARRVVCALACPDDERAEAIRLLGEEVLPRLGVRPAPRS